MAREDEFVQVLKALLDRKLKRGKPASKKKDKEGVPGITPGITTH